MQDSFHQQLNSCHPAHTGAMFAERLTAVMERGSDKVHHIRAQGSHLGAPLYDNTAWAELIATTNQIMQR